MAATASPDTVTYTGPKGTYKIAKGDLTDAIRQQMQAAQYTSDEPSAPARPDPNVPFNPNQSLLSGDTGALTKNVHPEQLPQFGMRLAKSVGPTLASMAATAFMPEETIPAKMLASMLASTGTSAGLNAASGTPPSLNDVIRGLSDAGGTGVGGLAERGVMRAGQGMYANAIGTIPSKVVGDAMDIASSQASRGAPRPVHVPASSLDLVGRARDMGLAPDANPGGLLSTVAPDAGSQAIRDQMAEPMLRRSQLLSQLNQPGVTATRMSFSGDPAITTAREEVRRTAGTPGVQTFNKMLNEYIDGGTVQSFQNTKGNVPRGKGNPMRPMLPSEWESDKELWAKHAQYGTDPETQAVKARLNGALADAIRGRIEALTPPAVPGGIGQIEGLNREYQSNIPIRDMMDAVEQRGAQNVPPGPAPGGKFSPLRMAMDSQPGAVRSRVGLALANPGAPRAVASQSPEMAHLIGRLLMLSHASNQ